MLLGITSLNEDVRYQVFVSSTFTDLKEERERVLQAILECQAFPAGMELFPSADDEQFEFIKREIDSSDYYLLVIAGRYGSTAAKDGISFTEKEFDYALSQKKPILTFIVKDPSDLPMNKCEVDVDRRNKLNAFREKAQKSRLCKFFTRPDELKSQVLQALNYQFRMNPRRGWVPAGNSTRNDLEEIRQLQAKVIELEAENARLRSIESKPEETLAHGQDHVSWVLETQEFIAPAFGGNEKAVFPYRRVTFEPTWDELLCALYPSGTSRLEQKLVPSMLFYLLVEQLISNGMNPIWKQIANVQFNNPSFLRLPFLSPVIVDVFRQLAGLGLIEEALETTHIPAGGGTSISKTTDLWRLTKKGQEYLARTKGFRRTVPSGI